MKLGPMFKWFGSKWQSAKRYPKPTTDTICEPFAGGAGFSLNYSEKRVVLWDDDPNLQILWPWLINSAQPSDIKEIPINVSVGTDIRSLGLNAGQAMLLKHWQRTNNVGDCWTISPWGNMPGQFTANCRARLADEIGGIKHWEWLKPIELIDVPEVWWFIDPPYEYNYRYRSTLPKFDYQNLCSFIQTIHRTSKVIVCEAIGKNGELPTYLPFVNSHLSVTSRRKETQSHHSKELVYIR